MNINVKISAQQAARLEKIMYDHGFRIYVTGNFDVSRLATVKLLMALFNSREADAECQKLYNHITRGG